MGTMKGDHAMHTQNMTKPNTEAWNDPLTGGGRPERPQHARREAASRPLAEAERKTAWGLMFDLLTGKYALLFILALYALRVYLIPALKHLHG
jgi:hypothetical protein